jgi:rhodanese-related sulfurtransferase
VGNRTIPASQLLVKAGYSTVYNVTGGIVLWIEAGLPIEPVKND